LFHLSVYETDSRRKWEVNFFDLLTREEFSATIGEETMDKTVGLDVASKNRIFGSCWE
jgi:hypothetical protein